VEITNESILEERDPEGFGMGEGGGYFECESPITGTEIMTLEAVEAYLTEMGC
jgi:hypothetical protein